MRLQPVGCLVPRHYTQPMCLMTMLTAVWLSEAAYVQTLHEQRGATADVLSSRTTDHSQHLEQSLPSKACKASPHTSCSHREPAAAQSHILAKSPLHAGNIQVLHAGTNGTSRSDAAGQR